VKSVTNTDRITNPCYFPIFAFSWMNYIYRKKKSETKQVVNLSVYQTESLRNVSN